MVLYTLRQGTLVSEGDYEQNPTGSMLYGMNYAGLNAWEGIRSYKQENGSTAILALRAHIDRLFDSAKVVDIEIPYSKEEIIKMCEDLVEANGGGDQYLRPIVYWYGNAEKLSKDDNGDAKLDIYSIPIEEVEDRKYKLATYNFQRGYPQYDMQVKTSANYKHLQDFNKVCEICNVDDVLVQDNQGYFCEASVANIFVIKDNLITTPPNDGNILPGITRKLIANIIQNKAIMIQKYNKNPMLAEKKITKTDLYTADEIILCGTYSEVRIADDIDGRKLPGSKLSGIIKGEFDYMKRNLDKRNDQGS